MAKISLSNINAFFEGNYRHFKDALGFEFFSNPDHIKEQVAWRAILCYESCYLEGYYVKAKGRKIPKSCSHCGCSLPGKWYSERSCGSEKYPDMMNEKDWEDYKKEKNIKIDFSKLNEILNGNI